MPAAARGKKRHLLGGQTMERRPGQLRLIEAERCERGPNFLGRRRGVEQEIDLARTWRLLGECRIKELFESCFVPKNHAKEFRF